MEDEKDDLCKFNQKGFCKFQQHCYKRHESKICKNLGECKNEKCQERHPQTCKYFRRDHKCRYNEKCAYLHIEKSNEQGKLNEILAMALAEQIKTTSDILNEVSELKTKVQYLENKTEIMHQSKEFTEQEATKESERIENKMNTQNKSIHAAKKSKKIAKETNWNQKEKPDM